MDEYQVLSFMFCQLWEIGVKQTATFKRLIVVITAEKNVYARGGPKMAEE